MLFRSESGRFQGVVTQASLHKAPHGSVKDAFLRDVVPVTLDTDLHQLTGVALSQDHDVPVTDGTTGRFVGVVSCRTILKHVMERRSA